MPPTNQRLETRKTLGGEADDGLKVENEFIRLKRAPQVGLDRESADGGLELRQRYGLRPRGRVVAVDVSQQRGHLQISIRDNAKAHSQDRIGVFEPAADLRLRDDE